MRREIRFKIPFAQPLLGQREQCHVADALASTWISGGAYVRDLEQRVCRTLKAPYGLSVANGTGALHLALATLKLKPTDEVIVPGFCFAGVANMVLVCGAKVVYADVDMATWCLDAQEVGLKVTTRTRAIIAVHNYGNMCNMPALARIARRNKIILIEDCAEAIFSSWQNRYAGTWGDVGTFSFQAAKTITTGEGGFITTRHRQYLKSMQILRDHGMDPGKRYWHDQLGFNYRLTNIQAALGVAQMKRAPQIIKARKKVHGWYRRQLFGLAGIDFQAIPNKVDCVLWALALRIDSRHFPGGRDGVMEVLKRNGIETRPAFFAFGQMPFYQAPLLKNSDDISKNVLVLPIYPGLSLAEVKMICHIIKDHHAH